MQHCGGCISDIVASVLRCISLSQNIYCSAPFDDVQGWASLTLPPEGQASEPADMSPLIDTLVQHIPAPKSRLEEPFAFCVAMIERDPFVGRIATGEKGSGCRSSSFAKEQK